MTAAQLALALDAPLTWAAGAVTLTGDITAESFDAYVIAVDWPGPNPTVEPPITAPSPSGEGKGAGLGGIPTPLPPLSLKRRGPLLPNLDPAAYISARRQNLYYLRDLYVELLATLDDYEKLTGMFGHAIPARSAVTPMLEHVERNLGLVPSLEESK